MAHLTIASLFAKKLCWIIIIDSYCIRYRKIIAWHMPGEQFIDGNSRNSQCAHNVLPSIRPFLAPSSSQLSRAPRRCSAALHSLVTEESRMPWTSENKNRTHMKTPKHTLCLEHLERFGVVCESARQRNCQDDRCTVPWQQSIRIHLLLRVDTLL